MTHHFPNPDRQPRRMTSVDVQIIEDLVTLWYLAELERTHNARNREQMRLLQTELAITQAQSQGVKPCN